MLHGRSDGRIGLFEREAQVNVFDEFEWRGLVYDATPGLREAWDSGDYSKFHGWDRRTPGSMPTSYVEPGKG